jgi:hypothetical protein
MADKPERRFPNGEVRACALIVAYDESRINKKRVLADEKALKEFKNTHLLQRKASMFSPYVGDMRNKIHPEELTSDHVIPVSTNDEDKEEKEDKEDKEDKKKKKSRNIFRRLFGF